MSAHHHRRRLLLAGFCACGVILGQTAATSGPRLFGGVQDLNVRGVVHFSEPVPCHPNTEVPNGITINADGSLTVADPNQLEILSDQITTTTDDIGYEIPPLLLGNDSVVGKNRCDSTIDLEQSLPQMGPPQVQPPPAYPPPAIPPAPPTPLPQIVLNGPGGCLFDAVIACSSAPLNCNLPFCGRDIIFVHGLIFESLIDAIKAGLGLGGDPRALANWPQDAIQFTGTNGYYRNQAFDRWDHFIRNKLAPRFATDGAAHGPRFLIVAWAAHQRMEIAAHAILDQIATAIRTDADVMTVSLTGDHQIVDASQQGWWVPHTFCERGCVIVSSSNGGPLVAGALAITATPQSRPWWTQSLGLLPRYIKGHVAFHPALGGSAIADVAVGVGLLGGASCSLGIDILNNLSVGGAVLGTAVPACQAMNIVANSAVVDLMPQTLSAQWRPMIENAPYNILNEVPSVIIAGAHPTSLPLIHWVRPLNPGFDDGVVSVDSQMGRPWIPGLWPLPENLPDWNVLGVKYYDRGSPSDKAIPYFVDQNLELLHLPGVHAGSVNPYLSPTGMILSNASFGLIPPASAGLRNFHSFLQTTSTHSFMRNVGSGVASPSAGPLCPADSYNYLPTGTNFAGISNALGLNSPVMEESRAVFEPAVYSTMGRNQFGAVEVGSGPGGAIPVLSPRLKTDIELQSKGRSITVNFKLFHIHQTFWLWKRQYLRMANWRCRDEIDYAFDYAFRR